jgi:hypothetical protein
MLGLKNNRRGQFIPMATLVMLSVLIFMIGMVNVYRISRAKLKAQNLSDAVSLYLASQMAQSVNMVTDENEWLNHLYVDTSDPRTAQTAHDPCNRTDPHQPPGLGCFYGAKNGDGFQFQHQLSFKGYASLVQTINHVQQKFASTYNNFIGAPTTQGSNGVAMLRGNLLQQFPDLNDSNIHLITYNSEISKTSADTQSKQSFKPSNKPNDPVLDLGYMRPLNFVADGTRSFDYKQCGVLRCTDAHGTMSSILGTTDPVGFMKFDERNGTGNIYLNSSKKVLGAGAIVTISVPLIGLGSPSIQAKSSAYVVMSAGSLTPDQTMGTFSPTFWVKLGKP